MQGPRLGEAHAIAGINWSKNYIHHIHSYQSYFKINFISKFNNVILTQTLMYGATCLKNDLFSVIVC